MVRPSLKMPQAVRTLQQNLLKKSGGDREMGDVLALVLQHDEEAVLCAVEMAPEAGVPTKTRILNLLHRLTDEKTLRLPDVDPPPALVLRSEPKADVGRYDGLLETRRKVDMRHDPASGAIVIMLRSLKLCSMACPEGTPPA